MNYFTYNSLLNTCVIQADIYIYIIYSHGERDPLLALVDSSFRDGVSLKILVWIHLKPKPQLL